MRMSRDPLPCYRVISSNRQQRRLNADEAAVEPGRVHPISAAEEHLFCISGSCSVVCGGREDDVRSSGAACFC